MQVSVVVTVLNEESSISPLLESLVTQSKRADEIIIVDGGSKDQTVPIVKHFQRRYGNLKLIEQKSSRAKARNLGIELASKEIIAITDAGCSAKRNWLREITNPFKNSKIDMVAGFYKMIAKTDFEKAETVFLGTMPSKFNLSFLPSSRSVAFRKSLWDMVGGYPEKLEGAAEDTVFNFKVIKSGAKIARAKSAVVEWSMPKNYKIFFWKIFNYAKGDAKSRIFFFPTKGSASHNLKAIGVFLRYILGVLILALALVNLYFLVVFLLGALAYLFLAYRKVYIEYTDVKVALWGIILQILCDFSVMGGFLNGIFERNR